MDVTRIIAVPTGMTTYRAVYLTEREYNFIQSVLEWRATENRLKRIHGT